MSKRKQQPQQPDEKREPEAQIPTGSDDALYEVAAEALRAAAERADSAEARVGELEERLKRALADFRN